MNFFDLLDMEAESTNTKAVFEFFLGVNPKISEDGLYKLDLARLAARQCSEYWQTVNGREIGRRDVGRYPYSNVRINERNSLLILDLERNLDDWRGLEVPIREHPAKACAYLKPVRGVYI